MLKGSSKTINHTSLAKTIYFFSECFLLDFVLWSMTQQRLNGYKKLSSALLHTFSVMFILTQTFHGVRYFFHPRIWYEKNWNCVKMRNGFFDLSRASGRFQLWLKISKKKTSLKIPKIKKGKNYLSAFSW